MSAAHDPSAAATGECARPAGLRVLLVSYYFAPDGGAAANRLLRLATAIHGLGMDVRVLTALPHFPEGRIRAGYRGRLWMRDDRNGLSVRRVWVSTLGGNRFAAKLLGHMSFMVTGFLRGLFMPRPDVMLIEAQPVFAGVGACLLARLRGIPYVLNVSDLWPDHLAGVGTMKEQSLAYRVLRRLIATTYGPARTVVAMTPLLGDKLRDRIGTPEKVHTVINGLNLDQFRPDPDDRTFARSLGLEGRPLVAFVGTFATAYDFECMIGVIEHCARTVPQAIFLFVGTGTQMGSVGPRLARCGNVRMVEWLPADAVPAAWHSADLTWWVLRDSALARGTIPAKLFEAFACGVPVVAGQRGYAAEFIAASGGGVVVEPGDIGKTAAAIEGILASKERRAQMSAAARTWAQDNFDSARGVAKYADFLQAAVKR